MKQIKMSTEMIYWPLGSTITNMANYRHMYKMVVIADELLHEVPKKEYVQFMNGSRPFIAEESLLTAYKKQNEGISDDEAKITLTEAVKRGYLDTHSVLETRSERGVERGKNYHDFTEKRGSFKIGYWRDSLKENNIFVTILVSGMMSLILVQVISAVIRAIF